jgi:hypothetical protein
VCALCYPAISGDWYRSGNDMQYILPPLHHARTEDVFRWLRGPWIGVELFAYYRPVTSVLWLAEFQAFGENVKSWQTVSVLLHVLSTVALAALLFRLYRHPTAALIGAFLWGTRYKVVPTLEWTPAQTDHFAGFFGISALLLLQSGLDSGTKPRRRWLLLSLSATLCLLAMGSKEIAYTVPLLGLLLVLRHPALHRRTKFGLVAGIFVLLGGFGIWRIIAMQGIGFLPGTATAGRSSAAPLTLSKWLSQMTKYLLPAPLGPVSITPFPAVLSTFGTIYLLLRYRERLPRLIIGGIGLVLTVLLLGGVEYLFMADTYSSLVVALLSLTLVLFAVLQRRREAFFVFAWGLLGHLPLYHVVYNAAGNVNYLPGTYWGLAWALVLSAVANLAGTDATETI